MELSKFARKLRCHDWTACMSDSGTVYQRARAEMGRLAVVAKTTDAHGRLFALACDHHRRFMWSVEEGRLPRGSSRKEVNEVARLWVKAYCEARGLEVTDEKAKALVGKVDGHIDWYGRSLSTARIIDWAAIDEME